MIKTLLLQMAFLLFPLPSPSSFLDTCCESSASVKDFPCASYMRPFFSCSMRPLLPNLAIFFFFFPPHFFVANRRVPFLSAVSSYRALPAQSTILFGLFPFGFVGQSSHPFPSFFWIPYEFLFFQIFRFSFFLILSPFSVKPLSFLFSRATYARY